MLETNDFVKVEREKENYFNFFQYLIIFLFPVLFVYGLVSDWNIGWLISIGVVTIGLYGQFFDVIRDRIKYLRESALEKLAFQVRKYLKSWNGQQADPPAEKALVRTIVECFVMRHSLSTVSKQMNLAAERYLEKTKKSRESFPKALLVTTSSQKFWFTDIGRSVKLTPILFGEWEQEPVEYV